MKVALKVALCSAAMLIAQAAMAATGSWTRAGTLQNWPVEPTNQEVHGSFHSGYTSTPTGAKITTVSWTAVPYPNGSTLVSRRLCYTPAGSSTYTTCFNITNTPSGTTNVFAGLSAFKYGGGRFDIVYIISGGTYPTNPTVQNTVTVNYTY